MNEDIIEKAISKKTRAIFAANILGLSCNLKKIDKICKKHNLILMIDNCESFLSKHNGKLSAEYGTFVSFHPFFYHFSTIENTFHR